MNWKECAIQDLRNYQRRRESLLSMRERISVINSSLDVSAVSTDKAPIKGGSSRVEDKIINLIVERDRLKLNVKATNALITSVGRGLKGLSKDEIAVLQDFYIVPVGNCVNNLCEKLNISKSQVYRLRDNALYKFTISCYGILDF